MTVEGLIGLLGLLIGTSLGTAIAAFWKTMRAQGAHAKNAEDLQKKSGELNDIRGTLKVYKETNDELRAENIAQRSENLRLRKDIEALNVIAEKFEKAEERTRENELKLATMQGRLDEQRQNYGDQIARMERRQEELIKALAEKTQRETALSDRLKIEQDKVSSLESNLAVANNRARTLETKVEELQATVSGLRAEVERLKTKPSEAQPAPPPPDVPAPKKEEKPNATHNP